MKDLLEGTYLKDREANCLARRERFWNKKSYHLLKIIMKV